MVPGTGVEEKLVVRVGASQDPGGRYQGRQEDAHGQVTLMDPAGRLLGKAAMALDGLGGGGAGDVASSRARDMLEKLLERDSFRAILKSFKEAPDEKEEEAIGEAIRNEVIAMIQQTSEEIIRQQGTKKEYQKMGTTVALALYLESKFTGPQAYIFTVGDTRAYHWNASYRRLDPLTVDHSIAADLIASRFGFSSESLWNPKTLQGDPLALRRIAKMLRNFSNRNVLFQYLGRRKNGKPKQLEIHPVRVLLRPGDQILLVTDGVGEGFEYHHQDRRDEEMEALFQAGDLSPQERAEEIIRKSAGRPDGDNLTAVVLGVEALRVQYFPKRPQPAQPVLIEGVEFEEIPQGGRAEIPVRLIPPKGFLFRLSPNQGLKPLRFVFSEQGPWEIRIPGEDPFSSKGLNPPVVHLGWDPTEVPSLQLRGEMVADPSLPDDEAQDILAQISKQHANLFYFKRGTLLSEPVVVVEDTSTQRTYLQLFSGLEEVQRRFGHDPVLLERIAALLPTERFPDLLRGRDALEELHRQGQIQFEKAMEPYASYVLDRIALELTFLGLVRVEGPFWMVWGEDVGKVNPEYKEKSGGAVREIEQFRYSAAIEKGLIPPAEGSKEIFDLIVSAETGHLAELYSNSSRKFPDQGYGVSPEQMVAFNEVSEHLRLRLYRWLPDLTGVFYSEEKMKAPLSHSSVGHEIGFPWAVRAARNIQGWLNTAEIRPSQVPGLVQAYWQLFTSVDLSPISLPGDEELTRLGRFSEAVLSVDKPGPLLWMKESDAFSRVPRVIAEIDRFRVEPLLEGYMEQLLVNRGADVNRLTQILSRVRALPTSEDETVQQTVFQTLTDLGDVLEDVRRIYWRGRDDTRRYAEMLADGILSIDSPQRLLELAATHAATPYRLEVPFTRTVAGAEEPTVEQVKEYLEANHYPGGPIQMIVDEYTKRSKRVVVLSDPHPQVEGTTYSEFLITLVDRLYEEAGVRKILMEWHPQLIEEILAFLKKWRDSKKPLEEYADSLNLSERARGIVLKLREHHWMPMFMHAAFDLHMQIIGYDPRAIAKLDGNFVGEHLRDFSNRQVDREDETERHSLEAIKAQLDPLDPMERALIIAGSIHVSGSERLKHLGYLLGQDLGDQVSRVLVEVGWSDEEPGYPLYESLKATEFPWVALPQLADTPLAELQFHHVNVWDINPVTNRDAEIVERIPTLAKDYHRLIYFRSPEAITRYLKAYRAAGPTPGASAGGLEEVPVQAQELTSRKWTDLDGIRDALQHGAIADVTQDFPVVKKLAHRAGLQKGQALLVPAVPMIGQIPKEPGVLPIYVERAEWKETLAGLLRPDQNRWVRFVDRVEEAQGGLVIGDRQLRDTVKGTLLSRRQAFLEVDDQTVNLVTASLLLQLKNEGHLKPGTILLIRGLYKDDLTEAVLLFA
ncbi:MAG: protein phosphatase 2C domain-containing protein [Candidatus Omnitrophica bacterium]|nr:protein phosphatase 2C domain-containing protein [Candidatus Omnitrophota bacterium]